MENERRFCKKSDERMMAVTSWTRRIIATLGTLLISTALKNGAIQIETKALCWVRS